MLIPERQSRLQELLASRGISDLESLASELNVSQSTIRRDVDAMVQQGIARRTHGGVIWVGDKNTLGPRPYAFEQRLGFQLDAKRKIAKAAKSLIQPGETVLIDGGTTTYYLAEELVGQRMQIVTNSLPIANLFLSDEQVELIVTGGLAYPRYGVLLGPTTESVLATIHTKTMFFSVAGLNDGDLYNQNVLLVQSERKMMQQSQQVVLLVDSTKFGQQALVKLCDMGEIDVVVTDAGISADDRAAVKAAGCELMITE
jgi:DeoR/GlpR family transcriptional regulator of sugar metabolism